MCVRMCVGYFVRNKNAAVGAASSSQGPKGGWVRVCVCVCVSVILLGTKILQWEQPAAVKAQKVGGCVCVRVCDGYFVRNKNDAVGAASSSPGPKGGWVRVCACVCRLFC